MSKEKRSVVILGVVFVFWLVGFGVIGASIVWGVGWGSALIVSILAVLAWALVIIDYFDTWKLSR